MHKLFIWLLVLLSLVIFTGCVHEDELPKDSKLPWSRPASWEGQSLGIPL